MEKQKTILLVEDDYDFLEQMKIYLEASGYKTLQADSEKKALELINNESFDAAIMDLMMENQDSGFILSYKIKKRNEKIPVILVTAVTKETGYFFDKTNTEDSSWIKADAILHKDIRLDQLKLELNKLLTE